MTESTEKQSKELEDSMDFTLKSHHSDIGELVSCAVIEM